MKKQLFKTSGVVIANFLIVNLALAATTFDTVFTNKNGGAISCASYECWIKEVWKWSMGVMIPLSALILTAAGVMYMTSEGDSGRIGIAKKMIIGVVSGLGLLILSRLLLMIIFGDASIGGWIF